MTEIDPRRAEMRFRFVVSVTALVLVALAIMLRGLPDGVMYVQIGGAALLFLAISAGISLRELQRLDED